MRLAVSEGRLLVRRWLIVLFIVIGAVAQNAVSIWAARALAVVLVAFVLTAQQGWARNYWIERTSDGMALRTRRLWHVVKRESGAMVEVFAPGTPVRFDDAAPAWWRCDRGLWIGDRRFAVYPDGRDRARQLAEGAADSAPAV